MGHHASCAVFLCAAVLLAASGQSSLDALLATFRVLGDVPLSEWRSGLDAAMPPYANTNDGSSPWVVLFDSPPPSIFSTGENIWRSGPYAIAPPYANANDGSLPWGELFDSPPPSIFSTGENMWRSGPYATAPPYANANDDLSPWVELFQYIPPSVFTGENMGAAPYPASGSREAAAFREAAGLLNNMTKLDDGLGGRLNGHGVVWLHLSRALLALCLLTICRWARLQQGICRWARLQPGIFQRRSQGLRTGFPTPRGARGITWSMACLVRVLPLLCLGSPVYAPLSNVYDVAAGTQLPVLGATSMTMRVELLEVDRYDNGSRLVRLAVDPGTRITSSRGRGDDMDMHSFPAFFTQAVSLPTMNSTLAPRGEEVDPSFPTPDLAGRRYAARIPPPQE